MRSLNYKPSKKLFRIYFFIQRFILGVLKEGHGAFTGGHKKNRHFGLQFTVGKKLTKSEKVLEG